MASGSPQGKVSVAVLRAVAVLLLICAAVLMAFAPHVFVYRAAAMACVIAVGLISRVESASTMFSAAGGNLAWYHWTVSVVLAIGAFAAFYWLYLDALAGYHEVAPVFAFAAVSLVSAVWFGGVASGMIGRRQ